MRRADGATIKVHEAVSKQRRIDYLETRLASHDMLVFHDDRYIAQNA
jgi:hypothetical protein